MRLIECLPKWVGCGLWVTETLSDAPTLPSKVKVGKKALQCEDGLATAPTLGMWPEEGRMECSQPVLAPLPPTPPHLACSQTSSMWAALTTSYRLGARPSCWSTWPWHGLWEEPREW